MQHRSIIVTSHNPESVQAAWEAAIVRLGLVSEIMEYNGLHSFFIAPGGPRVDKAIWHNNQCEDFKDILREIEDLDWVEVNYGEHPHIMGSYAYSHGQLQ